jgi:hypothetical protein
VSLRHFTIRGEKLFGLNPAIVSEKTQREPWPQLFLSVSSAPSAPLR